MPVEAVRLVLGEHDDLEVAGVHHVREREVDEPVDAAERDRRLGPVGRERHQPLSLPASEDDDQDLRTSAAVRHDPTLVGSPPSPGGGNVTRVSFRANRHPQQGVPPGDLRRRGGPRGRAGPGAARARRPRRAGARLRRAARRGRHHRRTPTSPSSPAPTRALHDPGRRPGAGRRLRGRRPRALAHLVRQHGRPPRGPDGRHPARGHARTASSRCGRGRPSSSAAATASRRGSRRPPTRPRTPSSRSAPACARTSCASYPSIDPDRVKVVHNGIDSAAVAAERDEDVVRAARRRPRPAAASSSSAGSPGRRGCPTCCARPPSCRPRCSSCCCAGAPDTPEIKAEVEGLIDDPARDPRRRRLGADDAAAQRGRGDAEQRHRVRLPVGLRAARHRQPRGDGLRAAGGRHRDRRHPRGRRRTARPAGWCPSTRSQDGTGTPVDPDRFVADLAAALTDAVSDTARADADGPGRASPGRGVVLLGLDRRADQPGLPATS